MNKTTTCSYTVKQIIKSMKSEKMNFDFPIQRESGQWTKKQKSLFIHSVLQGYDVPDIYVTSQRTEQFEKNSILDGKQRCTTLREFYEDRFALDKEEQCVELDGVTYDVAGKKYSQLCDELQDCFLDYQIRAKRMDSCTDEEIEEQFFRLNNGSVFTSAQKANVRLGSTLAREIANIANGNFFRIKATFSEKQRRNGDVTSCILQTMMIVSGFDYKSMSTAETIRYAEYINDEYNTNSEYYNSIINQIENCFFSMYNILSNVEVGSTIKRIHIPALVANYFYSRELISGELISEEQYDEFLKNWVTGGINDEEYQNTCGQGSTNKTKVENRIDRINNILIDYCK